MFGAYLIEEKSIQSSTLKSYFSAIKHVLKLDGYKWTQDMCILNTLTRACRTVNDKTRVCLPIRLQLLEILLFELSRIFHNQPYLEILYQTIFLLSYYGLFRIGELTKSQHQVKAKDVHIGQKKDKILTLDGWWIKRAFTA